MITKFNQFLNEEYRTKGAKSKKTNKLEEITERIENKDITFLEYMMFLHDNKLEKHILKPRKLFDVFYEIEGNNLIDGAVIYGRIDFLKKMKDKGVDLHDKDNYCLRLALDHGTTDSIEFLLNDDKSNDKSDDKIRLLNGVMYNLISDYDDNEKENIDILELLLKKGANPNHKRNKLLSICTEEKKYEFLKLLIEYGFETNYHSNEQEERLIDSIDKIKKFKEKRNK